MARVDEHNDQQSEEDRDQDEDLEDEIGTGGLREPFDPSQIRIGMEQLNIDSLAKRIEHNEIDLAPDFQRERGLWKPVQQSRLIESLLIRIPIPAFYFDATNDDRWVVIDGLQRLTVFDRFIIKKEFALSNLEFLIQFNGKNWDDLPRPMKRRIIETQVSVYKIQPGTPPAVKFNIFKRINTGGLPLSMQEIRHALNQGNAADFLKKCSDTPVFANLVRKSMNHQRMADRECVLRFLAFAGNRWADYGDSNFHEFLNDYMASLNRRSEAELNDLFERFKRSMEAAFKVFGNDAFRKRYSASAGKNPINKALFEAWSVNLDALTDADLALVIERYSAVREAFIKLMGNPEFEKAISQGTGDLARVKLRFAAVKQLLLEVIA